MSTEPTRQIAAGWPTAQKMCWRSMLEKHMWRDMSESWLGMVGHAERDDFAAEEREHGTNQSQSESCH
jgi:hypothetical protein